MRDIKFRVFDSRNKKMIITGVCYQLSLGVSGTIKAGISGDVLMQYTGLNDKNGKDVYEGDIVLDNGSNVVVSYGLQEVDAFEGMGWNLWSHYGEKADGVRLSSSIEVIGNIWENPELLDEQ